MLCIWAEMTRPHTHVVQPSHQLKYVTSTHLRTKRSRSVDHTIYDLQCALSHLLLKFPYDTIQNICLTTSGVLCPNLESYYYKDINTHAAPWNFLRKHLGYYNKVFAIHSTKFHPLELNPLCSNINALISLVYYCNMFLYRLLISTRRVVVRLTRQLPSMQSPVMTMVVPRNH